MSERLTTELHVGHPTKWGPDYVGTRDLTITYELHRSRGGIPRRYDVHVGGERVGWVTGQGNTWSGCKLPAEGEFQGELVVDGHRTRAEAVNELLWKLRHDRGPVTEAIEGLWT